MTKVKELPVWIQSRLNSHDLQDVEEAVQVAEKMTSGEIVPVVVRRSSTVSHIPLILFLLQMLLFILLGLSEFASDFVVGFNWVTLIFVLVALVISRFLAQLESIERWFTPKVDQAQQVEQRAQLEFYESKIHATEGATGIMLYLSLMERQAVVLADQSIAERLPTETWNEVVDLIIAGIKKKNLANGLVAGVHRCGELLSKEFPRAADDVDELPNHLVIKEC